MSYYSECTGHSLETHLLQQAAAIDLCSIIVEKREKRSDHVLFFFVLLFAFNSDMMPPNANPKPDQPVNDKE